MFIEYIARRMKEKFEVDRYEEYGSTYLGMGISEINNEDSNGIVAGSNKYGDEVNPIEIPHFRTRAPNGPLAESDQANLRSELGKLIRIARIARPGVMYDALAAAQTFPDGEMIGFLENARKNLENGEKGGRGKGKEGRYATHTWLY